MEEKEREYAREQGKSIVNMGLPLYVLASMQPPMSLPHWSQEEDEDDDEDEDDRMEGQEREYAGEQGESIVNMGQPF